MHGLVSALNVPDLWQQEAVRALAGGSDVIIDAPTGAGKTRVFELLIESTGAAKHGQAVYTVPTRALANDKWREWQARGWTVGLATGDRAENIHAPVLVATLETQRERILAKRAPAILVVDEYQMIADPKRGLNYELALALLPPSTRVLLLSGSVRNPSDIADWLRRLGREVRLVHVKERPVPLDDMPVENLPRVPDQIQGFWPRLVAGARMAGLTPLLIFAPRRADSEKIARKIADTMPPERALEVPADQEQRLGRDLARMIRKRVAYHHSGLPYHARAGWIEPLAKLGHLDVVVATTGLAAGINFAVRSVFVADTRYFDGPFQRELRPDELLQMFGRAGRRGIDTRGTVLYARESPRLFDAAQRQLRRVNVIDWPTLVRVMEEAARMGNAPLTAAADLCRRLFSLQSIPLGFESSATASTAQGGANRFAPTREEFLNSRDEWQPLRSAVKADALLSDVVVRHRDRWRPALRVASVVECLGPGRLCKLPLSGGGFRYGKELAVAHLGADGLINPLPWLRKKLRLHPDERFSDAEFEHAVVPLMAEILLPGVFDSVVVRNPSVALRISFASHSIAILVDTHGAALLDPPVRRIEVVAETNYETGETGAFYPPPGTAANAWRSLGLVGSDGRPTARGRVFSRFQGGEGLVVAAALEDITYDPSEIVLHLANLRGGHRFADLEGGASDRLAIATRSVFGHVDHPGYLDSGLPPGYGPGTWEALERFRTQGISGFRDLVVDVRTGDIERATLEWFSLLRHIVHASDPEAPRWEDLQSAAARVLSERAPEIPKLEIDGLPHALRQQAPRRPEFAF